MSRTSAKPAPATAEQFRALVELLSTNHAASMLPPTIHEGAIEEIREPLTMLECNIADGDKPWAMIQNLAEPAGAVERFAKLLSNDLTREQLAGIIEENKP